MSDTVDPPPTPQAARPVDPGSLLRSKNYRVLLVLASVLGVVVSVASWGFLELIHYTQQWVYKELPGDLGFGKVPVWWPLPVLAVAGVLVAFAIIRLPGTGGHQPADGVKAGGGPTQPIELPGVVLAALASVGLGMVLGPEAPLIGLGTGLAVFAVRRARKDAPDQVVALMAAAASFAAISSLFGSPIVGAIIIIEAAGLGGPTLPVILLPGLLAAGIGSLVFIGMGSLTGLSTSAYAIPPLSLPAYHEPTVSAFVWTIVLAIVVAIVVFLIVQIGKQAQEVVSRRPWVVIPVAALVVGGLAIAFGQITGKPADLVLFSGQDGMGQVVNQAATLSVSTLVLLILFKGLAYAISHGQRSRRPDVSRDVPRDRRRPARLTRRVRRNARGGRADGRRDRVRARTSTFVRHPGDGRLPGRTVDRAADHRRGCGGLYHGACARCTPRRAGAGYRRPPSAAMEKLPPRRSPIPVRPRPSGSSTPCSGPRSSNQTLPRLSSRRVGAAPINRRNSGTRQCSCSRWRRWCS